MVSGRMCQFPEMEASQLWAGREAHLRPTNVRRHSGGGGGQRGPLPRRTASAPPSPGTEKRWTAAVTALLTAMAAAVQSSGFKWVWLLTWWCPLLLDRPPPVVSPCSVWAPRSARSSPPWLLRNGDVCRWRKSRRRARQRVGPAPAGAHWAKRRWEGRPRARGGGGGARDAGSDGSVASLRADAIPGSDPEHHDGTVRWRQTPGH